MKAILVFSLALHAIMFCKGELCPSDWIEFGKSCYLLTDEKKTWGAAADVCIEMGGGLAVPDSTEEHRFIWEMFTRSVSGEELWIGCSDQAEEGKYVQPGDEGYECTYTDWASGEPSDHATEVGEDCVQLWYGRGGKMDDTGCHTSHFFICERSVVPFSSHSATFCLPAEASERYTRRSLIEHAIKELLKKGFGTCGSACKDEPECWSLDL